MGIRDEELKRLVLYAKGLGLKVTIFNRANKSAMATWSLDGKSIEIFAPPSLSKTEVVLSLIHELGHHNNFVHDKARKIPASLSSAWGKENDNKNLTKKQRELIYKDEYDGTLYWDAIVAEVNIKIPKWKIEAAKEKDLWVYEYFVKHNHYPTKKLRKEKFKEINAKWRNK